MKISANHGRDHCVCGERPCSNRDVRRHGEVHDADCLLGRDCELHAGCGEHMVGQPSMAPRGPWYRWPRPAFRKSEGWRRRRSRNTPETTLSPVPRHAQHSLKYDSRRGEDYDWSAPGRPAARSAPCLRSTAKATPAAAGEAAVRARLAPSGLRKLYQPTHDRHYLVTCELHCDEPGFPRPARPRLPGRLCRAPAFSRLSRLRGARSEEDCARDRRGPGASRRSRRDLAVAAARGKTPFRKKRAVEKNEQVRARTRGDSRGAWRCAKNSMRGKPRTASPRCCKVGIPGPHERIGEWQVVDDEPSELLETYTPMFPVFADPAFPNHDAKGRRCSSA